MELRLAAVLAARVAGFRRLLHQDEAANLAALQARHHALIDLAIATHRGRLPTMARIVQRVRALEPRLREAHTAQVMRVPETRHHG